MTTAGLSKVTIVREGGRGVFFFVLGSRPSYLSICRYLKVSKVDGFVRAVLLT